MRPGRSGNFPGIQLGPTGPRGGEDQDQLALGGHRRTIAARGAVFSTIWSSRRQRGARSPLWRETCRHAGRS